MHKSGDHGGIVDNGMPAGILLGQLVCHLGGLGHNSWVRIAQQLCELRQGLGHEFGVVLRERKQIE